MNSIEDFCHLYQQMRQAQNNYFASKKGNRFPTPESKKLLVISKQLEAELDSMVQNFLTQKQAGDILNDMEALIFMEGNNEEDDTLPIESTDLNKAERVLRNVLETFLNFFEIEDYDNEVSVEEVKEFTYLLKAKDVVLLYFGNESEKGVDND
jgi:hypothetical protein